MFSATESRHEVRLVVDAVRNLVAPSWAEIETLRAANPRVLGIERLEAEKLMVWASGAWAPQDASVLVFARFGDDLEDASHFTSFLQELPRSVRGLDFQNLACSMRGFPVSCLPSDCQAFGTVVLLRNGQGSSNRFDMPFSEFAVGFPAFPRRVKIVRAVLGSEGQWWQPGEVIADTFIAKFPGMTVLQLEVSLRPSSAASDVPFVEFVRRLFESGICVEVTKLRCRAVQYEYLRAALGNAGAYVHNEHEEYEPCVYPFSHPMYDWPCEPVKLGGQSSCCETKATSNHPSFGDHDG